MGGCGNLCIPGGGPIGGMGMGMCMPPCGIGGKPGGIPPGGTGMGIPPGGMGIMPGGTGPPDMIGPPGGMGMGMGMPAAFMSVTGQCSFQCPFWLQL